jgi:hypothetical protein
VSRPNTPGLAGYLLGVCVSDAVCAVLLMVPALFEVGPHPTILLALALYSPFAMVEVAVFGLPVAIVGVVGLHILCRPVAAQGVHVAVAGVLGFGVALCYAGATHLGGYGPAPLVVAGATGIAAATGRAAVIPLVHSRRRRLAPTAPLRVP